MNYTLAIDPGKHACGGALFFGTSLVKAAYLKGPEVVYEFWRESAAAVAHPLNLILEQPMIYPGSAQQKGDLNDLLPLMLVDGQIIGLFQSRVGGFRQFSHRLVYPYEWKGQMPKAAMNKRVLKTLTETERSRIESVGAKDHNTLDAVGIGLWAVGRLNKKVIAR
jgi:hypothetical protein